MYPSLASYSRLAAKTSNVMLLVVGLVLLVPRFPMSLSMADDLEGEGLSFHRVPLSHAFHGEGATFADFNRDGEGDVAVGSWIYLGPDYASSFQFYDGKEFDPLGYSDSFVMAVEDVDADGWDDILVVGFPGAASHWYRNPQGKVSAGELWSRYEILSSVDNESPTFVDINQDGKLDLVCGHQGQYGFASPIADATQPWPFHAVTPKNANYQRFTHGLGVGDVDNDGDLDLLEQNGWWQNPAGATPAEPHSDSQSTQKSGGDDRTQHWQFVPVAFSSGGSQMYAVDLDGDGKNEVVTGLAAHGYGLVYYRSTDNRGQSWERVTIMGEPKEGNRGTIDSSPSPLAISQLHAVEIADIDGDGRKDIVTGKRWWAHANHDPGHSEPCVLAWFQNVSRGGSAQFRAHVIDVSSGVGTQLSVGDVNSDGKLDMVIGNKRGAFLFLQSGEGTEIAQRLAIDERFCNEPALEMVETGSGRILPALKQRALNLDFGLGNWTDWEARGPLVQQALQLRRESGQGPGDYWVNTDVPGEKMIGECISRPFRVVGQQCKFLLGGSGHPEARVEIVSDASGKVLATFQPRGNEAVTERSFDSQSWMGQLVRIRIIDHAEDGWVQFDEFHFEK